MHRFQTVVFNAVFGMWFIHAVLNNLVNNDCAIYTEDAKTLAACLANKINYIMPPISNNNLVLLGLSSAAYAALKMTENKSSKEGNNLHNNNEAPSEVPEDSSTEQAVG